MIELVQGNIVHQQVDAIVNAANRSLYVGSGVDGAIHDAGGPSLHEETSKLYPNGCPTGSAVVSTAGNLQAKYVFHAVGPVWFGDDLEAEASRQLVNAYRTCLELAVKHDCKSIAFPAISTGVYGFPIDKAAKIAMETAVEFLKTNIMLVRFVLFDREAYSIFENALEEARNKASWIDYN
jgi:O-acetyl-ADP-ribose deacetylase (regulator of RNase III)